MKVETELKAGNLIDDASQFVGQVSDQVGGFVAAADQQVKDLTSTVSNTASSAWNSITGLF